MNTREVSLTKTTLRFPSVVIAVVALFAVPSTLGQKITSEQLVSKHLESIGTESARSAVTTRIIAGSSTVIFLTEPKGQASGLAVLASDGHKNLIGLSFPSPVYPREQFGFDGNDFMAAFVTPGVRSSLGSFLMAHSMIFKQGLMGGVLSSAWALSNLSGARLEYEGEKKIENHNLYQLRYFPRGSSDLQITLFFDVETFRHVRTEYLQVIPAQTGSRAMTNVEEREIRYKMIEDFSDFKRESNLMLPHKYAIKLFVDSQSGTFSANWQLSLGKFMFNEPIDPASFTFTTK